MLRRAHGVHEWRLAVIYEVGASAELGDEVPADVKQMIGMCEVVEQGYETNVGWNKMFGLMLQFRKEFGHPTLRMGVRDLNFGPGASRTVDLLNAFMVTINQAHRFPGVHFGVAVASETLGAEGAEIPSDVGLEEAYDDFVASGTKQGRMVVGRTASGWQFYVGRWRHGDVQIAVAPPDQELPGDLEIVPLVAGINDRYTAMG